MPLTPEEIHETGLKEVARITGEMDKVKQEVGFQGTLQYKLREKDSGFFASPIEPMLTSDDSNSRPCDLEFGPDGALYVVDWFNPLIGHMQHSIRDPNRDHTHGRIWRITNKNRPLVTPPKIAGESIPKLLDLLKLYEDRTRYRVHRELRTRNTEELMAELKSWMSGLDPKDPDYQHHLLEALWVPACTMERYSESTNSATSGVDPEVTLRMVGRRCYLSPGLMRSGE